MDGVLTARYDNPDEVHEEVITPEVVCFGPAVGDSFVVVVEHARCIVEDITVYLTQGNQRLKRVS